VTSTIHLKMAAGEQLLRKFFPRSLNARLCARKRETKALCKLFLRESLILGEDQGLPILVW
jgi:hypothetical protein